MTTIVHHNGITPGKGWARDLASIDRLVKIMATEPLSRTFEDYGDFAVNSEARKGYVVFFGNFYNLSHAFSIESDDKRICAQLVAAIKKNKRLPGYLSQPNREERRAAKRKRVLEQLAAFKARRMPLPSTKAEA